MYGPMLSQHKRYHNSRVFIIRHTHVTGVATDVQAAQLSIMSAHVAWLGAPHRGQSLVLLLQLVVSRGERLLSRVQLVVGLLHLLLQSAQLLLGLQGR